MKKTLLKTLIILMSVMIMCIGCVQANVTSGYTFGINPKREDETGNTYVHTFQTTSGLKYIWNVQQYNNGIADTEEIFYCLAQGYGDFGDFAATAQPNETPRATGGTSQSSYSGPYRLKDTGVQATLNSLYNGTEVTAFTGTTFNGLLWMFDNMYIPGKEDRELFLNKIPCFDDGNLEGMSDYTVKEAIETSESSEDDITDIDIQIAQQLAIWTLTNPETVPSFPSIYLSLNEGALKTYADLYTNEDPDTGMKYGRLRNYCIKMIYSYLVNGAGEAMINGYTGDDITTVSVYANAAAQPVVTITREKEITGEYNIVINKVDSKGTPLVGATFKVGGKEYTTDEAGTVKVADRIQITEQTVNEIDTYKMTEIKAPTGYVVYDGEITLKVTKKLEEENYIIDQANIDETSKASGKVKIEIDSSTNTITVIIIEDNIDLALRKFISKVVDKKGTEVYSAQDLVGRIPNADETNIKEGKGTTGEYNHTKQPVRVSAGDKVTYTLRVYNEGESDAYITEITDYLSKYLEYVENGEWIRTYGTEQDKFGSKATTELATVTGASDNLQNQIGKVLKEGILLPAYDKVNDKVSYVDVQIICEVLQPEIADEGLSEYEITNIAEITGMLDRDRNEVTQDIDSTPENVKLPETEGDWIDYKDEEIGKKDYIPGQEDDDDFEKVVIVMPKYDLSLRKFIIEVDSSKLVDEKGRYTREPQVDTTTLKQGIEEKGYGTATYNHPKTPVEVKRGNVVTYVIRVYNEGNVDAYVSEITDTLPEYLEYLADDEINKEYGWTYDEETREVKTTITARDSKDEAQLYTDRSNGKLLLAYAGADTLDYIDVKVRCRVSESAPAKIKQTNIAEITGITAPNGDKVEDADSIPDGNLEIPEDDKLPHYKEDEENNKYVPGQEDDDDFEKVLVKGDFDLALRKFITQVNNGPVNNRYPQLSIDEEGDIKYTHTKEPVEVCYQDTVIYTIRIYNEGEIDGYANEITDDVPEGLEFIIDNEVNKEYRWVMLDENEQVTEDVTKAKYLVTDYLSEDQEKETGRKNLIKAFDKEAGLSETNPDYRDVKIAFKVTYQVTSPDEESRILVNVAQISEDSDDDIDSVPNRDEEYDDEPEDDIDYDNVKVKYFDLSLLKWVTQAIVVENGETKIIETGHKAEDNPEKIVKVEIKSKDVKKVVVKFAYKIRITNEGEIAGYANEITDYIPEGLKFVQEDNPEWYERREGVVATDQLKNTLLQPGESAEVEIILTWINGEKNLGTKINIAEISKDDNPSDTPDIDSTPDNEVPEEDDIDDAPVMLVIKTGLGINPQYTILGIIVMVIVISGAIAIKKFILE